MQIINGYVHYLTDYMIYEDYAVNSEILYELIPVDDKGNEIGEDGESSFLEKYTGFDEKGYERIETSEINNKVVDQLSDQHRYIFKERFLYNKSQSEIAKVLGVSQMTVSRAEKKITKMFREELKR